MEGALNSGKSFTIVDDDEAIIVEAANYLFGHASKVGLRAIEVDKKKYYNPLNPEEEVKKEWDREKVGWKITKPHFVACSSAKDLI